MNRFSIINAEKLKNMTLAVGAYTSIFLFMIFNEILCLEVRGALDKVIVRKGTIYVSQRGIYFYSKIFQQKTRERILFHDMSSIDLRSQGKFNNVLKIDGKKKYKVSFTSFERNFVFLCLFILFFL